jgi:hypothetical protein
MKEMDIANRTIGRLADIYEHVALRDREGGDSVLDKKHLWREQVIDMTNSGRPVTISSDRIFESAALGSPPLSSSQSNISAQVGLADDEGSTNESLTAAPAAGGGTSVGDDDMQGADVPDESDADEGDHVSEASNRGGPCDDLGEPSDDVTAALICLCDHLNIEDEAIRTVSLNIATEPVVINHPTEKRKHVICPKCPRNAMVYDIAECRRWIREAMVVIVELPKAHRMPHWGPIGELYE